MGAILLLFSKSSKINIEYSNIILLFVAYAICVNFAWYLIVLDSSYMMSTVYWIFNLLFFLLMMNLNQVQIKFFYEKLLFLIPFSYIVEIIIWASNLGRYDLNLDIMVFLMILSPTAHREAETAKAHRG